MLSKAILALAIGGLLFVRTSVAADTPALTAYEAYANSIRSVAFHSRFDDRLAESKEFTNSLSQDWKIDFVGKRKWCTTNKPADADRATAKQSTNERYSEQLIEPNRAIEVAVNPANDQAEVCTAYLTVPESHWESNHAGLSYLAYPLGYLETGTGYQNIVSLLRSDDVKGMTVEDAGSQIILKCETPVYEVSLCLNPEKGWMPEQIECKRVAPTTDSDQLTYAIYVAEKSSKHDGIWLPDKFRCHTEYAAGLHQLPPGVRVKKQPDGEYMTWITSNPNSPGDTTTERPARSLFAEVTLTNIKLNSTTDDDFRLHAKIPDGLKVSMQDAIHEKTYEWRDGKIVQRAAKR